MILEQIYRNFPKDTIEGEKARMLLSQTHWFSSIAEWDPRTAEALPQTLSAVLRKITADSLNSTSKLEDRLWRITDHVRLSLENLYRELNEAPQREHAILPIRAVRELDTTSFMSLSRRPGRNIREKLAGKPYMLAVQRVQSVDLPENRLLKSFSEQLVEFLELRAESLGEKPDELVDIIYSWLQTDEAQSISDWDNVPPNNTLLTHRDYRTVYDAWRWLQTLDEALQADLNDLDKRQKTMTQWQTYGKMYASGKHIFAEMPVLFNYDRFEITPWTGQIFTELEQRTNCAASIRETVPACIDLTELHPVYALIQSPTVMRTSKQERHFLHDSYLWQLWKKADMSLEEPINLFNASALYLHADATTVSAPDLFFSKKHEIKHLDRAAHSFVLRLRETFTNNNIVWLLPDFLNDFELTVIRRNINTVYSNAQPLPRSVAAVFENIDYNQLVNGFSVIVLDNVGGIKCATKLVAKFDKELKKCLPETRGFYWERHPSVVFSDQDLNDQNNPEVGYDIATLDEHGKWHSPIKSQNDCHVALNQLQQHKRIGKINSLIKLSDSPVVGGIKFFELQRRANEVPLWRDQIPELSIKAWENGRYKRFYLVDQGTTVKTMRGKSIKIPVDKLFTLPAGKDLYQFPLFVGEDEEAAGFSAKLESSNFPLSFPLECKLELTFTYGEDDPYSLIFNPIDPNFRPIRVKWTETIDEVIINAPAPEYPPVITWAEIQNFPKKDSNETQDLLEWVIGGLNQLRKKLSPGKRETGILNSPWLEDKNGFHYSFAICGNKRIFLHENNFINGLSYLYYSEGNSVSFELLEHNGKYSGKNIAGEDFAIENQLRNFDENSIRETVRFIHKSLYFPIIQVWREGRSIFDPQCPMCFRISCETHINYLDSLLRENLPPKIKKEIFFILSCMHKDAPEECVSWIAKQVENKRIIDSRAVGFGIGDLSEPWQSAMFVTLVSNQINDAIRVFAYAIWRHPEFVWNFSVSDYQAILNRLCIMLNKITPCPPKKNEKDKLTVRNWVRSTTEPLELLLGLLRTRSSSNNEIKMLLQPHQKITKNLARLVEKVTGIVIESHIPLFSRVQLCNLPSKPEGDQTPDLLYALRLYLTGDDGANAIQITGVSDDDTD